MKKQQSHLFPLIIRQTWKKDFGVSITLDTLDTAQQDPGSWVRQQSHDIKSVSLVQEKGQPLSAYHGLDVTQKHSGGGSIPKSESTGPLSKDGICICACVLASQSLPPRPCFSCAVCIIDGLRQFANGELFTNPGTLHCFFYSPCNALCFGCSDCFSRFRPKYNANSSERPALITLCEMGGLYALPHHSLPSLTAIIIWEGPVNILIYLLRIYLLH